MSTILPIELTQGPDADEFLNSYNETRFLREALADYLRGEIEKLLIADEDFNLYDSPNLLLAHCDNIAERRGLRRAIKLLTGDSRKPIGPQETRYARRARRQAQKDQRT